jgi:hypothetical protein
VNEEWVADAIAEVWAQFKYYAEAGNPISQAHHLVDLSNAVADLATYHPRFNYETGEIEGVFE